MNSRVAFPFLVLPSDSIRFDGWMIGDPGQPLHPAGSILENWDYARDLEVYALVAIDWSDGRSDRSISLGSHGGQLGGQHCSTVSD